MTVLNLEKGSVFCFAQRSQFSALKKGEFQMHIDLSHIVNEPNEHLFSTAKIQFFKKGKRSLCPLNST